MCAPGAVNMPNFVWKLLSAVYTFSFAHSYKLSFVHSFKFSFVHSFMHRSREPRTQKLKSHLVRTQSLSVLPLKPVVGQYIAIHATLTAMVFPCLFLHSQSIHLHFLQNLSRFFLCWLWLTHGSCVGPQNKIGHSAGCRFPC